MGVQLRNCAVARWCLKAVESYLIMGLKWNVIEETSLLQVIVSLLLLSPELLDPFNLTLSRMCGEEPSGSREGRRKGNIL